MSTLHSLQQSGAAYAAVSGKCSASLRPPSNNSAKMMLMQAVGWTGNLMFLPATALFSEMRHKHCCLQHPCSSCTEVPALSSIPDLDTLSSCSNVRLDIVHRVHALPFPLPPPTSMAHLLSTVPNDICASDRLPLSQRSCACWASWLQCQHDPVPSSRGTEGICFIPLRRGLIRCPHTSSLCVLSCHQVVKLRIIPHSPFYICLFFSWGSL